MKRRQHMIRFRDGTQRLLEPGELVPDGASIYVPVTLMDGAAEDERDAAAAYEQMRLRLSQAWRNPAPDQPPPRPASSVESAYQDMVRRLEQAWREPRS